MLLSQKLTEMFESTSSDINAEIEFCDIYRNICPNNSAVLIVSEFQTEIYRSYKTLLVLKGKRGRNHVTYALTFEGLQFARH